MQLKEKRVLEDFLATASKFYILLFYKRNYYLVIDIIQSSGDTLSEVET